MEQSPWREAAASIATRKLRSVTEESWQQGNLTSGKQDQTSVAQVVTCDTMIKVEALYILDLEATIETNKSRDVGQRYITFGIPQN